MNVRARNRVGTGHMVVEPNVWNLTHRLPYIVCIRADWFVLTQAVKCCFLHMKLPARACEAATSAELNRQRQGLPVAAGDREAADNPVTRLDSRDALSDRFDDAAVCAVIEA